MCPNGKPCCKQFIAATFLHCNIGSQLYSSTAWVLATEARLPEVTHHGCFYAQAGRAPGCARPTSTRHWRCTRSGRPGRRLRRPTTEQCMTDRGGSRSRGSGSSSSGSGAAALCPERPPWPRHSSEAPGLGTRRLCRGWRALPCGRRSCVVQGVCRALAAVCCRTRAPCSRYGDGLLVAVCWWLGSLAAVYLLSSWL